MCAKKLTSLGSRFSSILLARFVRGLTLTSSLFRFTIPFYEFDMCCYRLCPDQTLPERRLLARLLGYSKTLLGTRKSSALPPDESYEQQPLDHRR